MDDTEDSGTPLGWESVQVREVVRKIPTTGKKVKQKEYTSTGLYPVIDQGQEYISGFSNRNDCVISVDDPVIVFGDHTKVVKLVKESFVPGADGVKVLQPLTGVSAAFLEKTLTFLTIDLVDKGYARHYQHLEKVSFYLPPLEEQRRIVAKIEELFSELDVGVESLKTARAQLKTYRQSVLETALKSNVGSDAKQVSLGELIGQINQGWSPKCELNRPPLPQEWAVIKTTAVQPMRYEGEEAKPLPSDLEPRPAITVKAGDFLMTRKGPRTRTGVSCLVKSTREKSMLCDTVYRFRCDEEKVDPEYLEIVLNAPSTVNFIDSQKSGISDSGISLNQKKVKGIPVLLAGELEEQRVIVDRVQERLSEVRHLEAELERSLERVDALRQSILKRAFEGKLVPQDPDDEPASRLLERIRQEQANQPKSGRRKRKAEASA